jgi:putative RNA 2'-phosphotransferase
MSSDLKSKSKYLSYLLRHHPGSIGLKVDNYGWANLDELIEKARAEGRNLDRDSIRAIIEQSEKKRFILSDDENFIRAGYGHSIDVDLQLRSISPPDLLFHGTAKRNVPSILVDGIRPGSRNFVHLSATRNEAQRVGSRHGRPVILQIRAREMHETGYDFFQSESENGIWLVSYVPVGFISKNEAELP